MTSEFQRLLMRVPSHERYNVEERAAMIEFEGDGCARGTAENLALTEYWRVRREDEKNLRLEPT